MNIICFFLIFLHMASEISTIMHIIYIVFPSQRIVYILFLISAFAFPTYLAPICMFSLPRHQSSEISA